MNKALSIRQPWADLIIFGMKDIENRTWQTRYRGPLLIHVAQTIDEDGEWRLCSSSAFRFDMNRLYGRPGHVQQRGFIIGSVDLIDSVTQHPSKWFEGPYGFVLANPVEFKNSIPYRGMPGFFTIPDEVMR